MINIKDRTAELPHGKTSYKSRSPSIVTTIVIHHSATPPGRDDALAFARYHVETNHWPGIGYHYVIEPDGRVIKTQPISAISYHAHGANTYGIGICLAGNFDKAKPPDAQWKAAVELIRELQRQLPHITNIKGHREVPDTHKSCPGTLFDINKFREDVYK
jgi:N-acetyl-anhydromuramyl-L-alanine amidase AmpD